MAWVQDSKNPPGKYCEPPKKNPAILCIGLTLVYDGLCKFMEIVTNTREAMGPFQISDTPLENYVIVFP